ncbi:MAG: hypothetical protein RMY34_24380 [Aulosira sp. DedQUE10]|nr:hypothetical protein [Aulosira sp. DedQUE10]
MALKVEQKNRRFVFASLNLSFSLRIFLVVVKRAKRRKFGVVVLSKKGFLKRSLISSLKKLKCNK